MSEPTWKKLAEELREKGIDNPNTRRLQQQLAALSGGAGSIEAEIIAEMALSLRRAEDRILTTLLELELLAARITEARAQGREADADVWTRKFNKRRDEARQAVLDLAIHREAIGFRTPDNFASFYPIPDAR